MTTTVARHWLGDRFALIALDSTLMSQPFLDRLQDRRPLLLDGPTGTELARRGVAIDGPAWSATALVSAPEVIREIHADYLAAGADVVTANTFRTHARNLREVGLENQAQELTRRAVSLAREATFGRAFVAGSMAPLEDCYRPDLVPSTEDLEREHAAMAESLADAGVDLILAETQNCIREAVIATRAAVSVGLPVLVSFVCGTDGRLMSGESLSDAALAVLMAGPAAILVNCLPVSVVPFALDQLAVVCGALPLGAYANSGIPAGPGVWEEAPAAQPEFYAAAARDWLDRGAAMIGGCCGTTPAHLVALRRLLDQ